MFEVFNLLSAGLPLNYYATGYSSIVETFFVKFRINKDPNGSPNSKFYTFERKSIVC